MAEDFAAFILTHGRPHRQATYTSLRHCGYTGPIWLVVDDQDPDLEEYLLRFPGGPDGPHVWVFSKGEVASRIQFADNFHEQRGVIAFARNACFTLARELGLRAFVQLDDDYGTWCHRFTGDLLPTSVVANNLDAVFAACVRFLESTPFLSVALAQGGDMFDLRRTDASRSIDLRMFRKAMNTFFCLTDRPFPFLGRVNEDVNTYVALGARGQLFGTTLAFSVHQQHTQQGDGGMTDHYLEHGTYTKSFYPVMFQPSSVKIRGVGPEHRRLHHRIMWRYTVPKIVDASLQKPREAS